MKIALLWDLDGTLLDTLTDLKDATNYALQQHGFPTRSLEEIRSFVGNGARRQIHLSLPDGTDEATEAQVLATYQAYYANHAQVKTCPYPGVLEALEELGKRYPMAVVSNKPDFAVKPLCKQFFGDIFALGEVPGCPRKPAPDMLHKALEALGADTCVYIGDSEVDVITAKNAGYPCLTVLWGFRDRDCLEQAGATHFCALPADLPQAINALVTEHYLND